MTPKALIAPARLAGTPLLRTQTDERLVDLVRAGNDAAFEAIVARYRAPLLRYCSRLLGDGRAEDALQQTFLRAYDGLRASDREMHLRPWLFRIAHNVAINALRERGSYHEPLSEQIDGVERPDQAHEKSERLREVVAAVGTLPVRQRDAIVLRELEGRSYDEIASSLGVSGGAVRQLLNRARTTLRAGVTALTPAGLLTRFPWAQGWGEESSVRVAELCGGAAAGTVVAKVCTTALLTGAMVGGVATTPRQGGERVGGADSADAAPIAPGPAEDPAERRASPERRPPAPSGGPGSSASSDDGEDRSRRRRGRDGQSGRGRSGRDDTGSRSGPGSGEGDREGGSEEDTVSEDRSGPSGSGSDSGDSEGSGSGDLGTDAPETERSGSGSSGTSGSGSSGSGSDSSGSDDDESDSSGP